MILRTVLLAIFLFNWSGSLAFSKSGGAGRDDPWNTDHINSLPVEVRHYIAGICGGAARALHDFATYNPQEKRWRINLEYLQCDGRSLAEYRRGDQCIDVDFVAVGSRWQLARKNYASCGF